jgi:hypothetical protein
MDELWRKEVKEKITTIIHTISKIPKVKII